MVIRTATASDAPGICAAHVAAIRVLNRAVYSAEQIEAWAGPRKPDDYQLPIAASRLFVAEENGAITGFSEYNGDEICAVYVHPDFARKGIGRRLFRKVVQALAGAGRKRVWLDASLSSVEFYRAMGCVAKDERVHRIGGKTDLRCRRMEYTLGLAVVRREEPQDVASISDVVERAFRPYSLTLRSEPYIVLALRRAGVLTVSLVAEAEGLVVGHVAISPIRITDGAAAWYGLGPLAVAPEFQRRGIGHGLVTAALAEIQKRGAAGCVVLGDPKYYGRFGFAARPDLQLAGVPPGHFQARSFQTAAATGFVTYHPAFDAQHPSLDGNFH